MHKQENWIWMYFAQLDKKISEPNPGKALIVKTSFEEEDILFPQDVFLFLWLIFVQYTVYVLFIHRYIWFVYPLGMDKVIYPILSLFHPVPSCSEQGGTGTGWGKLLYPRLLTGKQSLK